MVLPAEINIEIMCHLEARDHAMHGKFLFDMKVFKQIFSEIIEDTQKQAQRLVF